jgi:hypothetical protein
MDEETKEYINKSVEVNKVRIDGVERIFETRICGMDRAAVLKAIEIDRRLEEHNKLREEVLTDRTQFVRSETYLLHERTTNQWKDEVNDKLTKLMTKYDSRMTTSNWIAFVAVIITIINLLVLILNFLIRNCNN